MRIISHKSVFDNLNFDIKHSNCVFLVGAGISMISPTNLPSGPELKDFLLECLLDHGKFKSEYLRIKNNSKYKNIVPEVLFQDIFSLIKENIFLIYGLLEKGAPNHIHKTIAQLANTFNIKIFTTNFDSFIDTYLVSKVSISHIHGCLLEKDKMAILIKQIIRGMDSKFKLQFSKAVKDKNLYVFGYSGNDKDVRDLIKSSSPGKIFWLMRDINDSLVSNNLKYIEPANIMAFEAELSSFYFLIQKNMRLNPLADNKKGGLSNTFNDEKFKIKKKVKSLINENTRYALLKLINYRLQDYDFARESCKIVLSNKNLRKLAYSEWLWFVIHLCDCIIITDDDLTEGHYYLDLALADQRTSSFPKYFGILNNLKGLYYIDCLKPVPRRSLPYFYLARKNYELLLKNVKDNNAIDDLKDCLSKTYNNLGFAYYLIGDLNKAFINFKASLKIKKEIGDIFGFATTMVNISVAYFKIGNYKSYYYWKVKAEFYIDMFSLFYRQAYFKKEIAILLFEKGKKNKASTYFKSALEIFHDKIPSALKEIELVKQYLSKI